MSSNPRLRRTAAAAVLALGALGLPAVTAVDANGPATTPTVSLASSADEAAYKHVGAPRITRSLLRFRTPAGSTSYRFSTIVDGQPVRFNPCAPIRWTSSTARGPVGGLEVLRESVARIAAVTGTTWTYVGASTAEPHGSQLPTTSMVQYPPVNIGWSDPARSDLLSGTASTSLGVARTKWLGVAYPDGTTKAMTVGAVVALNLTKTLPLRGGMSWKAVTLHELGHAMGLAHVDDPSQLMATTLSRTLTDLQAGDLTGLAALGRNSGCVVVPGL